jgi:hypothetical protein
MDTVMRRILGTFTRLVLIATSKIVCLFSFSSLSAMAISLEPILSSHSSSNKYLFTSSDVQWELPI